jgi:hypothetical protein
LLRKSLAESIKRDENCIFGIERNYVLLIINSPLKETIFLLWMLTADRLDIDNNHFNIRARYGSKVCLWESKTPFSKEERTFGGISNSIKAI